MWSKYNMYTPKEYIYIKKMHILMEKQQRRLSDCYTFKKIKKNQGHMQCLGVSF